MKVFNSKLKLWDFLFVIFKQIVLMWTSPSKTIKITFSCFQVQDYKCDLQLQQSWYILVSTCGGSGGVQNQECWQGSGPGSYQRDSPPDEQVTRMTPMISGAMFTFAGNNFRSLSSISSHLTTLKFFQLLRNFLMRFSRSPAPSIRWES